MLFRVLWFVFVYLTAGTVITGLCIAIIGDDANKYDNKVITFSILVWPFMLAMIVFGLLTGIAIKLGENLTKK